MKFYIPFLLSSCKKDIVIICKIVQYMYIIVYKILKKDMKYINFEFNY